MACLQSSVRGKINEDVGCLFYLYEFLMTQAGHLARVVYLFNVVTGQFA